MTYKSFELPMQYRSTGIHSEKYFQFVFVNQSIANTITVCWKNPDSNKMYRRQQQNCIWHACHNDFTTKYFNGEFHCEYDKRT